ncbi:hypothetical protein GCM10010466_56970 [Planomonospora alba]|uniref:Uncharacterized protein n=2 Tax=Planomonospora alba TaxID=161354 RepID=A0ABP6NUY1_9ACTN
MAAARSQGSRVLVTDETTETSLTYANPDGTFTTEMTSGPVRVKQGRTWKPIDTTLVESDGVLRPRAATAQVEVSAGGDEAPLIRLVRNEDQAFALDWPAPLPKPRLEGNRAIFVDAAGPGADLVVTALPAGFRHDVVLRERPAGPVEFKLPVTAEGLTLKETEQGGLKLTDDKGATVAAAPEPFMYDTAQKSSPATAAPAAADQGVIDTSVTVEDGRPVLVLKPDPEFLTDPATTYPVTVDPTTTLTALADLTVVSPNAQSDGEQITVGNSDYSSTRREFMRALLAFDTDALVGKDVTDARLELRSGGFDWGCVTGQTVRVQRITSSWDHRYTFWNTQPATTTEGQQSAVEPGRCTSNSQVPTGTWTWSVTDIAKAWAGGAPGHGVMLRLVTEEPTPYTNQYHRSWQSSDSAGSGGTAPTLVVTYTAAPEPPDGNAGKAHSLYWTRVLTDAYKKVGGAPGPLSRAGAMMHGAVYDAVNSIWGQSRPYLVDVQAGRQRYGAVTTAIDYAAYTVLTEVWPDRGPEFAQALADAATLSDPPSEQDRALGESIGVQAARAMINARSSDGSSNAMVYTPGTRPGDWQPTDSNPAATPQWGRVKPFALASGSQFRPALPGGATGLSSLLVSQVYTDNFNEVKRIGRANASTSDRTAEQTTIAHFWANDLDTTYKPPGQLYEHTRTVVEQLEEQGTFETARLFALVGFAMADAGIAAWDAKYETDVDLWRPETAIRRADTDGNPSTSPDTTWKPESKRSTGVNFSPNFPAYVSGHATFAGAWAGVMRRYFGRDDALTWTASTNDPFAPGATRTFSSFSAAAQENALSRVYLGVHYRFDGTYGLDTGDKVADHVYTNYLR